MSDHKLNATLKAAAGYDAPWLTIGSDDPNELHALVSRFAGVDPATTDTAAAIVAAATKFQNTWGVKEKLGGQVVAQPFTPQQAANVQQYQQSAAQPAPIGPATTFITGQAAPAAPQQQAAQPPAPSCQHGQMTYREFTSKKNGKNYKAYFCPLPQGSSGQCKPVYVD